MKLIRPRSAWRPLDRQQRRRRLLSLSLLAAPFAHAAPPSPVLVLAGTEDIDHSQGLWLEMIYREAVRRLGYRLDYRVYPAKRASAMADSGAVDGEIHRVKSYGVGHPNLIVVPAPHFASAFAAYGLSPLNLADGWKSLGSGHLRVEYRAGVVYCEQMLAHVVPAERLSTAYGVDLGLKKLLHHRIDIYVDDDRSVDVVLQADQFKDAGIRKLGILGVTDAFAYLHKRHSNLAPQLAAALDQMRHEGLIERYRKQAYRQL